MFNKKYVGKKNIILALPFFPVSNWKNSGQWALTVCPTVAEDQQLMLSHIPAHLPGGTTRKYILFYASSNNETLGDIPKQHSPMKHLPWTKAATGTKMLSALKRQSKSCWDLDRTEQVLIASNQPQQAPTPVPVLSLIPLVSTHA